MASKANINDVSRSAPALKAPQPFDRRQTRLRDLKAADDWLDLPPLYAQEDQAVQRIEAFDVRLGAAEDAVLQAQTQAALTRDLNLQKSRARIEKLKDVQAGLEMVHAQLFADSDPSSQILMQVRGLMQAAQSQLAEIYDGPLLMTDGMTYIRPVLVNSIEKLGCAQTGKAGDYPALCDRDTAMRDALRSPNPVPVMEKVALLSLVETVNRVLDLYLAVTDDQASQEDEALLAKHQNSLKLLQRASRSQQKMLTQLTGLHHQLGELRGLMSLNKLKSSLSQLNGRALRELQGLCEIIDVHLPGLSPLVPPLKSQHQRLEQTCSPDFLQRPVRYSLGVQTPATPDLPQAIEPVLTDYNEMTDKVVVAFEILTAQSLEKNQELALKDELAELDDLLFGV